MKHTKIYTGSYAPHTGDEGSQAKAQEIIEKAEQDGGEIHDVKISENGQIMVLAKFDSKPKAPAAPKAPAVGKGGKGSKADDKVVPPAGDKKTEGAE